jgi:hypothetical protein
VILGQGLAELSKDKPATKQIESNTNQFVKTLESIESSLLKNISYLTTVSTGEHIYVVSSFLLRWFGHLERKRADDWVTGVYI